MKHTLILTIFLTAYACTSQTNDPMNNKEHTNALINSTSPYLLQHAYNPVNWEEWSPEILKKARDEDKPIIVSIGYSSCHWCHVMEKESFEDTAVARLMNENFITIKVDREERPDVDQVYMDAVQAMGLQGGWPLNVFLTPDQKPFYGGTYFPKAGWMNLLTNVAEAFANNRDKIDASAENFTKNLRLKESEKYKLEGGDYKLSTDEINLAFENLSNKFDKVDGGVQKSPKFPMPSVWQFLATYYHQTGNRDALTHLEFTLEKIADGGIYDHVGGGFARYSTDAQWHIPHFEKMLYDNGQLLSLYATGYKLTKNKKFKHVIMETIDWLSREMLDDAGGFYSALDADSEGEEGKFYIWTEDELKKIAEDDFNLIADYFDVKSAGNWEGKNALRVVADEKDLMDKYKLAEEEFEATIKSFKKKALKTRNTRVRPGLDNKMIAGWNGLTLSGLSEAYQALNDASVLQLAHRNASFIKNQLVQDGRLNRFPDRKMEGFLEDYAAVIQGLVKYYETTFDWEYLVLAKELLSRANEAFFDEEENLYFFTSDQSESLIARKKELFDNVIPSSNSIMTWNLIHVGTHFYDEELIKRGKSILAQVSDLLVQEPEYMSNWATTALELSGQFAEVVIVGRDFESFGKEMNQQFIPNKILTAASQERDSPLFEYKSAVGGKTTIYVCYDKSCKRPVTEVSEAISQLE